MDIPIWEGSSSFTTGSTPFGFYDTDFTFQAEIDKVANWCAKRLGYPIMNVELQSGSFYAAFEEAITVFGNEVYQYKIRENYLSMEGNSSVTPFNSKVINPSLGSVIRISKAYGSEAGTGGTINYYTGALAMSAGIQDYDLDAWATDHGITGSIEIKKLFYEAPPAITRYFDPYAGTGTGMQSLIDTFGFGNMSPGVNFMLMPINFDVLKIQAIEFNDQIRKSAFTFDLVNNKLRIFPIPQETLSLFFHYIKISERDDVTRTDLSGSSNIITNISNVPYVNPVYSQFNTPSKQWIYQYTLAISKEILGYIRKKYSTVPIPGSELSLNGDILITDGQKEKDALILQLRTTLEETSRKKQLEIKKDEAQFIKDQLSSVPIPIYIF